MTKSVRGLVRTLILMAGMAGGVLVPVVQPRAGAAPTNHYDHVIVVMMENHGYSDIIGNPAAPNVNALAKNYGLATNYYGISHPSEPNYVGFLGGSTYGVANDNPYYVNRVDQPSLVSQLDQAGISWKAYLQGSPHAGYQGICYPDFCNGTPDKDPLYVSKHNPVPNFTTSWDAADWSRQVPATQLDGDLKSGNVPAFGFLVPDECHDQHGDPPYCLDSGNPDGGNLANADPQDQRLVATGDQYVGQVVNEVTSAPFWSQGNNAVVVTWDEGNNSSGCCGANPGGGQVATVVVTSHGPRSVQDNTPYNHYSLLSTIQQNFGLGCLANTCDTSQVKPMTPLFQPTGSIAEPTEVIQPPSYPTPTPTPGPGQEPVTSTATTGSSGGWTVGPAPMVGAKDNSYGAISSARPNDVWAVGNYMPDLPNSNQDATISLAGHFDGTKWTYTPTPNTGPNFNTLFGVADLGGQAWAVGTALGTNYLPQALLQHWDGSSWQIVPAPTVDSSRALLFGVSASSPSDVWAVGTQQAPGSSVAGSDDSGSFSTLVEHFDGQRWTVVPAANPGDAGNSLYAVAVRSANDVWAVGQSVGSTGDSPLVEHFDGKGWHVVHGTGQSNPTGVLDEVSIDGPHVVAAGQTDGAVMQAYPLVGVIDGQAAHYGQLTGIGGPFSNINGITADNQGSLWITGTTFDPNGTYDGQPGGVQQTLIATHAGGSWQRVDAPSPGTADRVLGQVVDTGAQMITVGYSKQPGGREPLVETHAP
jgi:hypothetical protein